MTRPRTTVLHQEKAPSRKRDGGRFSSVPEAVIGHAHDHPLDVAVEDSSQSLTYRDLAGQAWQLSRSLVDLGVRRGNVVAIQIGRSVTFVEAALACLFAGATYMPVDRTVTEQRRRFLLTDAGCSVLLAGGTATEAGPDRTGELGSEVTVHVLDDQPACAAAAPPLPEPSDLPPVYPADPAYLIYTSGSTGAPKGVLVDHGSIRSLIGDKRLGLHRTARVAQLAPVTFDVSVFEIWGALFQRASVVVFDRDEDRSVSALGAALRRHRPDWLFLTAALFHLLCEHDPGALEHVGTLLAGGDVISPQHLAEASGRVRNRAFGAYGPTEATVFSTLYPAESARTGYVPLGSALRGTRTHVLDERLKPVSPGDIGELCIAGVGLAHGYHRRAALTAHRFVPDPWCVEPGGRLYRTGDTVRLMEGGDLEFRGRLDRQVKIRGVRVELGEIEVALTGHPSVAMAAAVTFDSAMGKRLAAYVSPAGSASLDATELRKWLQQTLPPPMVPTSLIVMSNLPRDANNKIQRNALPIPWNSRAELGLPSFVRPQGNIESLIAAVWADVLELDHVGAEDNIFEIGGDSLRQAVITEHLRTTGFAITMRNLYEYQTVRELAGFLDDTSSPTEDAIGKRP